MIKDVGDTVLLRWRTVDAQTGEPADAGSVTATLRDPDGAVTDLDVGHDDDRPGIHTVNPLLGAPGDWLVTFTSTGPAQRDEIAIHAVPRGEVHAWAPTLRQVGQHIQSRTRTQYDDGGRGVNEPLGTFTDDTYPTSDVVTGLIGSAVALVAGFVGPPIAERTYPLCTTAAALWAAYWVELNWPERDAGVSVYDRLRTDAQYAMDRAAVVNAAPAGGGTDTPPTTVETGDEVVITGLSTYSFPPPCGPVRL